MLAPFFQSLYYDDEFNVSARDWHRLNTVLCTRGAAVDIEQLRGILKSVLVCSDEQNRMFDRRFEEFFVADYSAVTIDAPLALKELRCLFSASKTSAVVEARDSWLRKLCRVAKNWWTKSVSSDDLFEPVPSSNIDSDQPVTNTNEQTPSLDVYDERDDERLEELPPAEFDPNKWSYFSMGMVRRKPEPFLTQAELSEAADSLGFFRSDTFSAQLDVVRSIDITVERGGLPTPQFENRRQLLSLALLIDAAARDLLWNTVPEELEAGLARRGVSVDTYSFHGIPDHFTNSLGQSVGLDDLEEIRRQLIVMLITDGHGMYRQVDRRPLERMSRWPRVALLDPRSPGQWDLLPQFARQYRIPLYPCDGRGVIDCLRHFTSEVGDARDGGYVLSETQRANAVILGRYENPESFLQDFLPQPLLDWARVCAVVPTTISLGLADHLRRRFFPTTPSSAIGVLLAVPDTTLTCAGIQFHPTMRDALLRGFQRQDAKWQTEVVESIAGEVDLRLRALAEDGKPGLGELQATFLIGLLRSLAPEPNVDAAGLARIWNVPELSSCADRLVGSVLERMQSPTLVRVGASRLKTGAEPVDRRVNYPADRLDDTVDFENGAEPVNRRTDHPETIGRFKVESVLGCGGFGTVYLAYDDELQRRVAVKVAHDEIVSSDEKRDAFLAEGRIMAALDHPNILPVYDVGRTDEGLCYVVSRLIDGHNLEIEILSGRLTYRQSAQIVAKLAEALDYAHRQGFVHRDIKPANVLVDSDDNPYITDYGLALHEQGLRWGRLIGTPNYMSPEQARGESHLVDGRSDVYSLGAVFYKMLTDRELFFRDRVAELLESIRSERPRPLREIKPSVPRELERICLKALEKRASERYLRAGEMADDLRNWISADQENFGPGPDDAPNSAGRQVRIVPKGLRSFGGNDADFFLRLLPGPYDRDGLPESIRFWKTLIERTDADSTFRAGLVYGPSGCGKTSMVKAGLLPRLADWVISIYVDATPDETERRLLRIIQKRFPELSSTTDLQRCLAALRAGMPLPTGKKLLIVVDQFEQWLHTRRQYADGELVAALRQCDGERLQCVLLVRDDFWMAITRFLRELEVPLVEGRNSAAVDLFDLDHARKVLAEFGRAFDRLPDNAAEFTHEQTRFLDESVKVLARDEHVIPVGLSLFAEMVKAKPWNLGTLAKVGDEEGVGLTFLEENLSAAHAPPAHRLHQKAIRAVLSLLLPEKGIALTGSMRSREELLEASGYAGHPDDFEAVLNILNALHLITPTDPQGAAFDETQQEVRTEGDCRYYQLTKDSLVLPVRKWLSRANKRKTSLSGWRNLISRIWRQ